MNKIVPALPVFPARPKLALITLIGMVLLLCNSSAMAQAGSKESQKFLDYSEDARDTLIDAKSELASTVALYNTLVAGEAEKPESTYKKLVKSLGKSEKVAGKTRDRVEKMQGQADKVFSAWMQELESYENEQLKELGMQRLDASKQRYDTMIERMQSASEAYRPLASSLHDQIKLMGFDLSPEAMNALQGPAEELNAMAVELYARIDAVLNQEQQDEATIADQDDVLADLDETLLDQDDALAEDSEQEAGE